MGFLSKIMGRDESKSKVALEPPVCPHTILIPRWDSIADMGKEDRATSYGCQSCSETFNPEEAKAIRLTTAERLRIA